MAAAATWTWTSSVQRRFPPARDDATRLRFVGIVRSGRAEAPVLCQTIYEWLIIQDQTTSALPCTQTQAQAHTCGAASTARSWLPLTHAPSKHVFVRIVYFKVHSCDFAHEQTVPSAGSRCDRLVFFLDPNQAAEPWEQFAEQQQQHRDSGCESLVFWLLHLVCPFLLQHLPLCVCLCCCSAGRLRAVTARVSFDVRTSDMLRVDLIGHQQMQGKE